MLSHSKKSYGTLSKGAIFFGQPCILKKQLKDLKKNIALSKQNSEPFASLLQESNFFLYCVGSYYTDLLTADLLTAL